MAPNPPGYVISTIRTAPSGAIVYELVTDHLQRMYVSVRRRFTDDATAHAVIDHAIAARYARPKPVR